MTYCGITLLLQNFCKGNVMLETFSIFTTVFRRKSSQMNETRRKVKYLGNLDLEIVASIN